MRTVVSNYIISRSHCLNLLRLANQYMPGTDQALLVAVAEGKDAACLPNNTFSSAMGICDGCIASHKADTKTADPRVIYDLYSFVSYCNNRTNTSTSFSSLQNTEASLSIE